MNEPARSDLLSLSEQEAHVWLIRTDEVSDPALLEQFRASLCDEERRRWERFSFAEGKRQFLISHGFVRLILSRYAGIPPADWRFPRSAHGKPEASPPPGVSLAPGRSLCFNLTHTRGLAACVVSWDREVGIDAEDWERQGRAVSDELIRRCLSPVERECFLALPASERKHRFFDYWTLKEAYLKARGFGLLLPVEEITFRGTAAGPRAAPVTVSFGPSIGDLPHTWQFERFAPSERHKVALALRRFAGPNLGVLVREFIP